MKQMSYVTRWLYSTSHKDIAILYLVFGMISAMVATGMSVLIRMELSNGNSQFFYNNHHAFNVVVTGHAIAMIFLFVMPVLIGAFGNFFVPIMIGAVDMAFARLNNISFWCLPPALVCVIVSVLIENGAGTGWTVLDKLFYKISLFALKTLFYFIIFIYFINYLFIYLLYLVKIFIIKSLNAYVLLNNNLITMLCDFYNINNIYQRLKEITYKRYYSSNSPTTSKMLSGYENLNSPTTKLSGHNNIINFDEWFIGFTEYNGSFNIKLNKNNIIFNYIIIQNINNIQILYKIKTYLGIGRIIKKDKKVYYIINNQKHLLNIIIPLFDKYGLLSHNYYNYNKFKESLLINNNNNLYFIDKYNIIKDILSNKIPNNYKSPKWDNIDYKNINDINKIISNSWLIGYMETISNYKLVNNPTTSKMLSGSNNMLHLIELKSNKLDLHILYSIKYIFNISNDINYISDNNIINYNYLKTYNNNSIENIINYLITKDNTVLLKTIKNIEFIIWKKSYLKYKNDPTTLLSGSHKDKLIKIQKRLRKLSNKLN